MALLYLGGLYLNPAFFGSTGALFSVLRDASRYGVMAVGMTFVIVNKELDLSVGSTFGLTATIFGMVFAPTYFNMSVGVAVFWCLDARSDDRPHQRNSGHGPGSPRLHRDADDAVHRPRRHSRPDRRQEHRVRDQGWRDDRIFRPRRNQRVRLQQSDPALPAHRRGRRGDAGAHLDRLDDLRHRRQRAGRALRRHQHAPRSHALLYPVLALRGHRRV